MPEPTPRRRNIRWGDILIITLVLVMSVSPFFLFRPEGAAARATVSVDGKIIKQISLPSHQTVELDNGVTVIFDGMRACISHSDCPDKTCVQKGWLSMAGQTSVCLPNRTVLSLDGGDVIIGG